MANYLKFIGILILAIVLWQMASTESAGGSSVDEQVLVEFDGHGGCFSCGGSRLHEECSFRAESCFTAPQLPYFPDAELAGTSGCAHSIVISRCQRLQPFLYTLSMKSWVNRLVHRMKVISLCGVRQLHDGAGGCRFRFVSVYYVIMLRRIII